MYVYCENVFVVNKISQHHEKSSKQNLEQILLKISNKKSFKAIVEETIKIQKPQFLEIIVRFSI